MSSTDLTVDTRDILFCLREWLKIEDLTRFESLADFDAETINLLIKEGHAFATDTLAPTRLDGDRIGIINNNGQAVVPDSMKAVNKQAFDLGWANLAAPAEYGGQGAPSSIAGMIKEATVAANIGLHCTWGLGEGVGQMINMFGSDDLKKRYLKKLAEGKFYGTMCLSEPHAGSDVGSNTSTAIAQDDGTYKIKGTKCWITGGDHDLGENIIHTVLARVPSAPGGTKGLSLFAVPKYWVDEDGNTGESNDVALGALEHKMGMNGSPTCVLNFGEEGNCKGLLIGELNQGMTVMFFLMNEARIGSGIIGLGVASAAYQNALSYAKERIQGTHINEMRNPDAKPVLIIEHPDVRLNLTGMKVRVEAARALLTKASLLSDIAHHSKDEEEKKDAGDLLAILTPMVKAWPTETGLDVCRTAIQVLGGVGYTKDFPVEMLYRDLRVSTIYEGTTGIQALDLVGRKMTQQNGKLFMKLLGRFNSMAEDHGKHPTLGGTITAWAKSCERMTEAAMMLQTLISERGMAGAALHATPFMMFLSTLTAGHFYLEQALLAHDKLDALKSSNSVAADDEAVAEFIASNSDAAFYSNKVKGATFFVGSVLPPYQAGVDSLINKVMEPLDMAL